MPPTYTKKPGYSFPGTVPRQTLDYFRSKDLRPGFSYQDVWLEEHVHAFTVAKVMQLDILDDLLDAVDSSLAEGWTYRRFAAKITPTLQQKGWWGVKEMLDPKTGKLVEAQLGSPRRLKTIYRANLRTARAAGQWQRIERTRATHPYLRYELGPSEQHRPEHAAWSGTLLPADDPWWRTHFPPNGWGCKCRVRQISRREAKRLGGPTAQPTAPTIEWTNKRTGETMRIPRGIDPGWEFNPGLERSRSLRENLIGKLDDADQHLARAAVRTVTDSPLLDRQLAPMKPGDPPKGDLPVAFLERDWKDALGAETQIVRLTQRTTRKQRRKHGNLTISEYREVLPKTLRNAQVIVSETGHWKRGSEDLVFFYAVEGKIYKAAVAKETNRRVRLATFYNSDPEDLERARLRGAVLRDTR